VPSNNTTRGGSRPGPALVISRPPGRLRPVAASLPPSLPAFCGATEGALRPQPITRVYSGTLLDSAGNPVRMAGKLAEGGEGQLLGLERDATLVAKLYFRPTPAHHEKLTAMIGNPPEEPGGVAGHVSICWPTQLLFRSGGSFPAAGFLMHRVDRNVHVPVLHMYNPRGRQSMAPGFHWGYLLRTARNIASVVESLHTSGYVLGDINESNFLVSPQSLVTLVDCDSMQVPRAAGGYFRCPVGKADFLAPELQGADYSAVDRTAPQDCFSLATLLFLLLMEGTHPFSGVWLGPGEDCLTGDRIAFGDSPYAGSRNVARCRGAPPLEMLPPILAALFVRCFGAGMSQPLQRPSAREWREALDAAGQELATCRRNPQHLHGPHLGSCPWCERTIMLDGADPFPAAGSQRELPPTTFARRSPVRAWWVRRSAAAQLPDGTAPPAGLPLRRLLVLAVLLAAAALGAYLLTRPLPPAEEIRRQKERIGQLQQRGELVPLQRYLADSMLRGELQHRPGTAVPAVQGFTAARPPWAPGQPGCEVPRGTLLRIKTYIDNTGYFSAEGHYAVAVSVPPGVCPGQTGLIIAPLSALPQAMRLLDCPGRGGSLLGFAWHSTEEWSCAGLRSP
jgi:hypothetical protein